METAITVLIVALTISVCLLTLVAFRLMNWKAKTYEAEVANSEAYKEHLKQSKERLEQMAKEFNEVSESDMDLDGVMRRIFNPN